MLKFFRQIRQNLLAEKRFSKYLLYAIGEIVLVVIGILIALQINNWNGQRKSEALLINSLEKLRFDVQNDLDQFAELDSIHAIWKSQNDYRIEQVLDGNLDKLDSIRQMSAGRGTFLFLRINTRAYNELINSGLIAAKDSSLKKSIDAYYQLADFELEKLNRDLQNFSDYILNPARAPTLNIIARLAVNRNEEHIDWAWLRDPKSPQYMDFEYVAFWYAAQIEAYNRVLFLLRNKAEITVSKINERLEAN